MSGVTDLVHAAFVPFLAATGGLLALLVCHIVVLHGVREVAFRRRQQLLALYRPQVEAALDGDGRALERLAASPSRHRPVQSALVLEPLRVTAGRATDRARDIAFALGLRQQWASQLTDRRWWVRADAAGALGLVRCADTLPALVAALDDPYDEVRAAAVEAVGRIGSPSSIPELVRRLPDQSRHQRVRLVHALQQFGAAAVAPVIAHGERCPDERAQVAELLGSLGAVSALDALLSWANDERAEVRGAVWQAIGAIGVDDRAYYHLLRALNDTAETVRAAAAWALGRSGRQDAAAYLAGRLDDEWLVAAQTARALRALGPAGRRELEEAASRNSELARQVLWECGVAAEA
jgi:HEAT repeat protein